jgi:aspartate aminotransferase
MARTLSARSRGLVPSPTLAIDAKARALKLAGVDLVNLSIGEPDFRTPEAASQAGIEAIRSGFTKYTLNPGTRELRQAIADKLERENHLRYTAEQIVVSNGAKQAVFTAVMVLVDPGDEVIILSPYWVSYPEIVRLAGGVPVFVRPPSPGGGALGEAVSSAVTARTKLIILNSPNNPTGYVYGRAELEALGKLAVERDLTIISDEIYEKLVYGETQFVSIGSLDPELARHVVTVNGFSKAYAMTGWRLGYSAAEPQLAEAIGAFQGQCTNAPSSIGQAAATAALTADQHPLEAMRQEFDLRRHYVMSRLAAIPGFDVDYAPSGAFYIFPRVSALEARLAQRGNPGGSTALASELLDRARVAVVPGAAFGADDHLRLSYASAMETLREGLDRIEHFAAELLA